jgi:hypothetical protein
MFSSSLEERKVKEISKFPSFPCLLSQHKENSGNVEKMTAFPLGPPKTGEIDED